MSRGPGIMQRYLFATLAKCDNPVTFAELRRIAINPKIGFLTWSEERSLRRALQTMVRDEVVLVLGNGGRADPHRYAIHPLLKIMIEDKRRGIDFT